MRNVNDLYNDRKKGDGSGSSGKDDKGNRVGGGGDPPESPMSSVLPKSPSSHLQKTSVAQNPSNPFLLKLDVKVELPMYNGELDAEKLDN